MYPQPPRSQQLGAPGIVEVSTRLFHSLHHRSFGFTSDRAQDRTTGVHLRKCWKLGDFTPKNKMVYMDDFRPNKSVYN